MLLPLTLQGVRGILPENSSLALPFCGAINSGCVSIFVMSNAMSVITPVATTMRRITEQDNPAIAAVIRTVSAEYGLTADKGYTVADPNLDELFQLYNQPGHAYWVIEQDGQVVGGGGIAPCSAASRISVNSRKCISCQRYADKAWRKSWRWSPWNMHAHRALNVATLKPPLSLKRPLACMSIWALSISMPHWAARATWTAKSGC